MNKDNLSPELKEFILGVLLKEIGKDGKIDPFEKTCFSKFVSYFKVSKDRVVFLKKEFKKTVEIDGSLGALDFKKFFVGIIPKLLEKHSEKETIDLILDLSSLFDCKNILSDNKLIKIIDGLQFQKNSTVTKPLSKVNKDNFDPESYELLISICEKDWQQSFEDFEITLKEEKVSDAFSLQLANEETLVTSSVLKDVGWGGFGFFVGILAALIFGEYYLILTFCGALLLLGTHFIKPVDKNRPLLESSFSPLSLLKGVGFLVGIQLLFEGFVELGMSSSIEEALATLSVMSAGFTGYIFIEGARRLRANTHERLYWEKKKEFYVDYNKKILDYVLTPFDVIRFWESKVISYLKEQKYVVSLQITKASLDKAECLKTSGELKKMSNSSGEVIQQLNQRQKDLSKMINDAKEVNIVIQKLEDSYSEKIIALRVVLEKQKTEEEAPYRQAILQKKAQSLLQSSDVTIEQWETSKNEYQLEITGMMKNFQEQLLHTKDFIEAEISLNQKLPDMIEE
ncbi:MAG: hypothetical protein COB02_02965 [Candidatus Cloacimonadota bacterium]|nr:MAG: hypothetical protein COB02_02965 [Candidatus Cloacimonadota bacterium]